MLELARWDCAACSRFHLQSRPRRRAQQLEAARRSIIAREAAELSALADDLARQGTEQKRRTLVRAVDSRASVARRADPVHAFARSGRASQGGGIAIAARCSRDSRACRSGSI